MATRTVARELAKYRKAAGSKKGGSPWQQRLSKPIASSERLALLHLLHS